MRPTSDTPAALRSLAWSGRDASRTTPRPPCAIPPQPANGPARPLAPCHIEDMHLLERWRRRVSA